MKISFEIPVNYLEMFSEFTDYDFILAHNLKIPKYFSFYSKRKKKVFSILDNSAFELEKPLEGDVLIDCVKKIDPNVVIAPDVLRDCESTLEKTDNFIRLMEKYNCKNKIAGVVQGKTFKEYLRCYKWYLNNKKIDLICVPFDVPFNVFDLKVDSPTNQFMLNRVSFLKKMWLKFSFKKPHHLLGASNPIEIIFYSGLMDLSMDTSSPIVHGLHGIRFGLFGLPNEKIKTKLDFHVKLERYQIKNILYNIEKMREWQLLSL